MSWIKNNKFLAALTGVTLVLMGLLFVYGSNGSSQYDKAKEDFDAAVAEAAKFERLPLYPKSGNIDGKSKALDEYSKNLDALQTAFNRYRPKEVQNLSPEVFTTRLKAANEETRKAFAEHGTKVANDYFCGFASYKTSLARGDATGILDYQLGGIRKLMLDLAEAGATDLRNVHRPELPEEKGKPSDLDPGEVARPLPLEITFKGDEKAVRSFFSSIAKSNEYYYVIRAMRVTNEKKNPPRASDAKFGKSPASKAVAAPSFSGIFSQLDGDTAAAKPAADTKPAGDAKPGADAKPAPIEDAGAAIEAGDPNIILSQVLGNEKLQVFVRLDLMLFQPAKKLP